ncbi:hypothetical protein [Moorena sp. SIO3I6]|nr:hypothetical protein [Moorena sp. SIO3I6]NEP26812.1 hypothetical protein [Moorena sp. SIO3I6]
MKPLYYKTQVYLTSYGKSVAARILATHSRVYFDRAIDVINIDVINKE